MDKLDAIEEEIPSLGMGDMVSVSKEPYLKAFHPEQNKKGWSMIGVKPFTRSVYWTLVEAERKQEAAVAAAPGVNHDVLTFGFKRLQSHAHDIVRAYFVQKKQKEEDKDKRKRLATEVSAGRLVKYARVADGAKAKLMAVGNKVIHAKLLKDELVAALRVRGHASAATALKAQLEADLQVLLGPPLPTGPCGMFF
ncbi:hypothetical protein CYMTET_40435 [Cymbomonas tetramitiformis]|uniref:Uncharacterized protein n=1 Tax=Cymbomonas tetramitiformis TaxID=36881 RepID=A0AAE0F2Z4_9CHLO|nr:hypothetical protein CYMTET_40435 [Cymbomonas tetramitiformis]